MQGSKVQMRGLFLISLLFLCSCATIQKYQDPYSTGHILVRINEPVPVVKRNLQSPLSPSDLVVLQNGQILVLDNASSSILLYDEQGDLLRSYGKTTLPGKPGGIAIGSSHEFYYTDSIQDALFAYNLYAGNQDDLVKEFRKSYSIDLDLSSPSSLEFIPPDDLYVADTGNDRIIRISLTGYIEIMEGTDEGCFFRNPDQIAVSDDLIFVAHNNSSELSIVSFRPGIKHLSLTSYSNDYQKKSFEKITGLTVLRSSQNQKILFISQKDAILVLDLQGNVLAETTEIKEPSGLFIIKGEKDNHWFLYSAERSTGEILKFEVIFEDM